MGAAKQMDSNRITAADDDRTYIVTELCPHCENEIEIRWDTGKRGFKAFCPVCGGQLMLCDECRHTPDGEGPSSCDYDRSTDTCHRGRVNGKKAEETPAMAGLSMSEYGKIRSMSDEQMADWISGIVLNCMDCFLHRNGACDSTEPCHDAILGWLRGQGEGHDGR